jgi:hypothetical protein
VRATQEEEAQRVGASLRHRVLRHLRGHRR